MSYTIRFSPDALGDYSEAYEWYEDKGVEKKFERAVLDRLKFIALYPEASPYKHQHLRGTHLKKFPYRLFFELNDVLKIATIVAILHDARDGALVESTPLTHLMPPAAREHPLSICPLLMNKTTILNVSNILINH